MNVIRPAALAPYGWSLALHVLLAGALFAGVVLPSRDLPPAVPPVPIAATIVDQAILQAAASLRAEERRRADTQRRQAEAAARRQEAALAAKRAVAEREVTAKAQARRKAELAAQRRAEEQARVRAVEESRRAASEARLRGEREAELRARLAAEEQQTGAAASGLKAQYVAAIQAHVERRWFRPPGIRPGTNCTVHVLQIPGGEVVGLRFGECAGGEALRRSIETAVQNASPLPAPPEPALFEREIRLVFTPEE
jgi:colicin import membrane protein